MTPVRIYAAIMRLRRSWESTAMLSLQTLPFMPRGRALRRYRALLREQIASEPVARLCERLLSLPLGLAPLPDASAILAGADSYALYGAPAGGRTLALIQTLAHWIAAGDDTPVLYLPLPEIDAANLAPRTLVAAAFHRAGLSSDYADGQHTAVLLLDDWELLPPERRALWQSFIVTTTTRWPTLRMVIALPVGGEPWPELAALQLNPPDAAQASAILAYLLPDQQQMPGPPELARLSGFGPTPSLADLALLALIYPLGGLPTSRAQLYAQAFALLKPLIEEQRLLAQSSARLNELPNAQPSPWSGSAIGRALLRHYRLARAFAGGDDIEALSDLAPSERAVVASLTVGLLEDPTPVLAPLWASGPDEASLRALVACAREAPDRAPDYGLRLLEWLLDPAAAPSCATLLNELIPLLPALFAAASRVNELRTLAVLEATARALPQPRTLWLSLLELPGATAALRWAAAEHLTSEPPSVAELVAASPFSDPADLAPQAYLAALGTPESRAALAKAPLREAVIALLNDPLAGEHRTIAATLILADAALPPALRACAVPSVESLPLLEHVAGEAAPEPRQAALAALSQGEPLLALAALGRVLAQPDAAAEARRATLDAIAAVSHQSAAALLMRATVSSELPLDVRLHALERLARRSDGEALVLRRLLLTTALSPVIRAAVAQHLGRRGVGLALPELARLLVGSGTPLLRRAAATALGELAQRPALHEAAAAALVAGLRRAASDPELGERIAHGLGQSGSSAALSPLAALLEPRLVGLLRQAWLRAAPALAHTHAEAWPELDLPAPLQFCLSDALAAGSTLADPPSRFAELAERHAIRLAVAAAAGLGALGGTPELRERVIACLRQALLVETRAEVARAILQTLRQLSEPGFELAAIFAAPGPGSDLRWLAIETLGADPRAGTALLERLALASDEPFVQAQLVGALGALGLERALPALRRLARDASGAAQLRGAAIDALICFASPEAHEQLVAIAVESAAAPALRVRAAAALPAALSAQAQIALRQALRAERLAPILSVALQHALARTGDREAITQLLCAAQSDSAAEALAGIEALAELNDAGSVPLLVRLSQSASAPPTIRLAAVIGLLHVGGAEHLPLLHEYLDAAAPALRLQAHAALARLRPADPRLGAPLAEPDAPLPLRLQALTHVATHDPDAPQLAAVVASASEMPQVRMAAAAALANSGHPAAVHSLAATLTSGVAPVLRRRCCATLGRLAHSAAPNAAAARACLASLVSDPQQLPVHRHWAAMALLG